MEKAGWPRACVPSNPAVVLKISASWQSWRAAQAMKEQEELFTGRVTTKKDLIQSRISTSYCQAPVIAGPADAPPNPSIQSPRPEHALALTFLSKS